MRPLPRLPRPSWIESYTPPRKPTRRELWISPAPIEAEGDAPAEVDGAEAEADASEESDRDEREAA